MIVVLELKLTNNIILYENKTNFYDSSIVRRLIFTKRLVKVVKYKRKTFSSK